MNELNLEEDVYESLLVDWDNDVKSKEIIKKYNLSISPNSLYKYIQPLALDEKCPYCGGGLVLNRRKRKGYSYNNFPECPNCGHQEAFFCNCDGCEKKKIEERRKKKEDYRYSLISSNKILEKPVKLIELSCNYQLFILSMVHSLYDISKCKLNTIRNGICSIYPMKSKILDAIKNMHDLGVINYIDIDYEYFNMSNDEDFYLDVEFSMNIDPSIHELHYQITQNVFDIDNKMNEFIEAERELLIYEIFQLMAYNMDIVGLPFIPGEKTRLLTERMIAKYEYGQIAAMIYHSANRTLRYVVEKGISKKHGYSTFIYNLDGYFIHAMQEGWEIRNSIRPKECTISSMRYIIDRIKFR